MSNRGKTINLYLMDGNSSGRYEVRLDNWNIITYKIPYGMINKSDHLDYIHTSGVYFLFSEKNGYKNVYVGESEDLLKRLTQHTPDKDNYSWSESISFVSTDLSLDKGKIKYLENRFYNIINGTGKYHLLNRNEPRKSSLNDTVKDSMESLIDNVKLVVPVIGHNPFSTSESNLELKNIDKTMDFNENNYRKEDNNKLYEQLLFIKNNRKKIDARGYAKDDGKFIVMKGSVICSKVNPSLSKSLVKIRNELIGNSIIVDYQLQKNIEFSSPSAAAKFVYGSSVNGLLTWITSDGKRLKEFKS